jgi:hypothetical protein
MQDVYLLALSKLYTSDGKGGSSLNVSVGLVRFARIEVSGSISALEVDYPNTFCSYSVYSGKINVLSKPQPLPSTSLQVHIRSYSQLDAV